MVVEQRTIMIGVLSAVIASCALAQERVGLLESVRDSSSVSEHPELGEPADDGLFGVKRLSMDFGVSRIGETSRALRADGAIGEIAGDEPTAQPVSVDGIEGPVRLYEAQVAWDAAEAGPFRLSVLGGVRAYGLSSEWSGVPGATISIDDSASDEIVPVPVFGGEMNVALAEGWSLRGRARGRALNTGSSYIDIGAETAWAITPDVDFIAGYTFFDASVEGSGRGARLHSDGLYAQVKWRF